MSEQEIKLFKDLITEVKGLREDNQKVLAKLETADSKYCLAKEAIGIIYGIPGKGNVHDLPKYRELGLRGQFDIKPYRYLREDCYKMVGVKLAQ